MNIQNDNNGNDEEKSTSNIGWHLNIKTEFQCLNIHSLIFEFDFEVSKKCFQLFRWSQFGWYLFCICFVSSWASTEKKIVILFALLILQHLSFVCLFVFYLFWVNSIIFNIETTKRSDSWRWCRILCNWITPTVCILFISDDMHLNVLHVSPESVIQTSRNAAFLSIILYWYRVIRIS